MRNIACFLFTLLYYTPALPQQASLLWKIEGNTLQEPSYLYGTMHSRDKRAHQFGDSVMAKLNQCDAVALELLTKEMLENPFAIVSQIMMKDTTLAMLISKKDYKLVKDYTDQNLGMYSMFVDNVMPIFIATLITEANMGDDVPYTVDEFFETAAADSGKLLIGIETIEEQMAALKKISLTDQAAMLVEQLKTIDKGVALLDKLMEAYQNQDLDAMMAIYTNEEMPESFDAALVSARNQVMAERIDSIIQMQSTFAAVGALHLAGNDGLIELMKQRGYTVTPVVSYYTAPEEENTR